MFSGKDVSIPVCRGLYQLMQIKDPQKMFSSSAMHPESPMLMTHELPSPKPLNPYECESRNPAHPSFGFTLMFMALRLTSIMQYSGLEGFLFVRVCVCVCVTLREKPS